MPRKKMSRRKKQERSYNCAKPVCLLLEWMCTRIMPSGRSGKHNKQEENSEQHKEEEGEEEKEGGPRRGRRPRRRRRQPARVQLIYLHLIQSLSLWWLRGPLGRQR